MVAYFRNCDESGKALVVDTITTITSQWLVVMPEACGGGGSGAQQAAHVLLFARQIDAAFGIGTAVFGLSQRLLPLTMCGNPNPDTGFYRGC